ncbi:MAG: porin, partial [Rubrivivax sp.]|nr:porin [Rubrivivax sp.]
MRHTLLAVALLCAFSSVAEAQLTMYGRIDLSLAQQTDAAKNTELRNGSGSRFGLRGTDNLGGDLKAVFQIEHRFNADTGSAGTRFWEGKGIVGLEGGFGRITMGREENPAYTYSQNPADPWGGDTVASNGSIVNGRIGTNRYSDSLNYRYSGGGFTFGVQITEGDGVD